MATTVDRGMLDELLEMLVESLTPDAAACIASLRASPRTRQRLEKLAVKTSAGTLAPHEEDAYSAYIEALDLIAILQAKARRIAEAHD
ncbi:MAG TPA: hypothetical protein VK797_15595 [Tepidisphaeraceae bacterium]|jgi:hypothetical protein|nr:hypothetical protein [Tepidisphaeraceae bacterium]